MKVLIVDSFMERRIELARVLGELPHVSVAIVANVRSAVAAFVQESPDVVITDVTLPDGDGIYLLDRARTLGRTPAVFALARTGSDSQRTQYLAAGVDGYLDGTDYTRVRDAIAQLSGRRAPSGSIPPHETLRLLGRITSGVVHDFNNYLHAADTALELMRRNGPDEDHLSTLRAAVDAMRRLNTTLLTYARGATPPAEAVDLTEVVRDIATLATRTTGGRQLEIAVAAAVPLRAVTCVRAELEQVLLNLVLNACDTMPEGGRVDIALRPCTAHAVLLEVSDRGTFTGEPTHSTKHEHDGRGLGLGTVRNVVARQGGALRFIARDGGGTTVAVILPVLPDVS